MLARYLLAAFTLAILSSCSAESAFASDFGSIIAKTPGLSMLSRLFETDPTLFAAVQDPVDVTFLAPSDEAMAEFLRITRGTSDYLSNKATRYRVFKDLFNYMTIKGMFREREFFDSPKVLPTWLENPVYHNNKDTPTQFAISFEKNGGRKIYGGQAYGLNIVKADIPINNGFIQIVDGFFKMPLSFSKTADILGFDDWLDYVDAVGLRDTIDQTPTTTIFIPAVDAKKVPPTNSSELRELIEYHIIQGRAFFSTELTKATTRVETVNGERIYLTIKGKDFFVNDAKVIKSDIITSAGALHILDRPLNPQKTTTTDSRGKRCNCLGQYCVDSDGLPCKLDASMRPIGSSSAVGSSDEYFGVETDGATTTAVNGGAIAALTAVFFCLLY
ncbi:FAS1 domain-containing protein [Ascodesmis nigricans]|uniref:FAS1 domain-containing protein n=1 Tax=Ascodesmis nigricans TaxID=341454 RepID=A0A4V3SJ40_9PEZI|nr:FAS1 domain-containing protein [Ascodesmis nigricans]